MAGEDDLDQIRKEVLARVSERKPPDPEGHAIPMPQGLDFHSGGQAPSVPPELPPDFLEKPTFDLRAWMQIWTQDRPVAITSHRSGVAGSLIVRVKRILRRFLRAPLADLFDRQRVYNAILIHHVSQVQDALGTIVERSLPALVQRSDALYAVADQRQDATRDGIARTERDLSSAIRGLEGALDEIKRELANRPAEAQTDPVGPSPRMTAEPAETLMENEATVLDRRHFYLPHFRGLPGPVLDLGAGHGELLQLLKGAGITAHGVDTSKANVDRCRKKGLDVSQADLLMFLADVPDASLGGLFVSRPLARMPRTDLIVLLRMAADKLAPNGRIALETQNPVSPMALARNFYLDLGRERPVHPEALKAILEATGFRDVDVTFLSPFPATALLPPISTDGTTDMRLLRLAEEVNDTVARLNSVLFGHQDYVAMGRL